MQKANETKMYNPTRRNRNIGTEKQGHGQDNRMVIPESWHEAYIFYEKLRNPVRVNRTILNRDITFLVEPPLKDFKHSCTVDDICKMLEHIPADDWDMLDIIVLRQPTRKQKIMSPVWGRLSYYYETKNCSGVAVLLEAQSTSQTLKWDKSLSPTGQRELESLKRDGHEIRIEKKNITIASTLNSCRNTQLFRTLPHEIGHYAHYLETEENRYRSIPQNEKEAAADRYVEELATQLRQNKIIPFEPILNSDHMLSDNLDIDWFR